ncbi:MAG: glycosyl transferase [Rhodobacteraceae bacterium PARR1]|nr:MAG: glycosyl transferase [Rhodobacteraceae bacterium PARR1]
MPDLWCQDGADGRAGGGHLVCDREPRAAPAALGDARQSAMQSGGSMTLTTPPRDTPDVSVLIAAYRAAAVLPVAVQAALASVGVRVEVIVVDDASNDATLAVVQRLAEQDARVRVASLAQNGGPSAARNRALAMARGAWVAVLDADDRMKPDRLARMIALGEARSGAVDVVLGNLEQVDGQGRSLGPFLPPDRVPDGLTAAAFIRGNMRPAGGQSLGYLKPVIRRDFLQQHGIAYDSTLRNGEDYHLILSCLLAGGTCQVDPVPGYLYTRAAGSVSHRIDLDHLAALIGAEDGVLATLSDHPDLAALVTQRRRGLVALLTTETVLRALKAGRVAQAMSALTAHPAAATMVLRQAIEGGVRRLRQVTP